MSKKRLAPKRRFKGFTDDWEQRKLGELLTERNEQAPMSEEFPLMAFIAHEGVAPKGDRYDRSSLVIDAENKRYKRTEYGDFIYSSNNLETGSIGLNTYGKACISPVYSIFQPTEIADFNFLGRRLVRKDFINVMLRWRQGVVYGQWRIHESDFLKIEIPVPSVEEQIIIGTLFHNLDHLITLHQRKLEKAKNLKKSLLSEMFPTEGERKPKRRFPGFTGDWEQRKLGEVGTTYSGLSGKTKEDFGHGDGQFVTYMNVFLNAVSDPEMTELVDINEHQNKVLSGDVFFTTSSETPEEVGMSSVWLGNSDNTYLNSFCFGFRPSIQFDPFFLAYMLRSDTIRQKIILLAQGISRYNISKKKMMDIEIPIPKTSEQIEIGAYFRALDHLITLHQRKLEKLQNLKKAYLNEMFI
jgi:type I restriction enzyme S subunit